MYTDASPQVEARAQTINAIMARLRQQVAKESSLLKEIRAAYADPQNSLQRLRQLMRSVAETLPNGQPYAQSAARLSKRKSILNAISTMLDEAGYGDGARYSGSVAMPAAPMIPMMRQDAMHLVQQNMDHLVSIEPPFPYVPNYPKGTIVDTSLRTQMMQSNPISDCSTAACPVACARTPAVMEINKIVVVDGLKHVQNFYEGNVIHVRLPYHKFKDPKEKCGYFKILRQAFDQYREEFAAHSNPQDIWWRRRVMTPWTVYLDEGIDAFDGPIQPADNRSVYDNDMSLDVRLQNAVTDDDGNAIARGLYGKVQTSQESNDIPICVSRFDGRNNVGHVRSQTFLYKTRGHPDRATDSDAFNVKNLLRFLYKQDMYRVHYQDVFPAYVRRMIIDKSAIVANSSKRPEQYDNVQEYEKHLQQVQDDSNTRANERVQNFLKQNPRNAVFIVHERYLNFSRKETQAAFRAVNEFCKQGQDGYERLAVLILKGNVQPEIESTVTVGESIFTGAPNVALARAWSRRRNTPNGNQNDEDWYVYADNNYAETTDDRELNAFKVYKFKDDVENDIHTPMYQLVRYSPQNGFLQLVQKRNITNKMTFSDADKQNIFTDQLAMNKPILINDETLRGFTNPDHGKYFYGVQNPDATLFVAKLNKFMLIQGGGKKLFIQPSQLPERIAAYLRDAALEPVVILGVQDDKSDGKCVNALVEDFVQRNEIPALDMLPKDRFTNVADDEYVVIRTQQHKSTGGLIMYQYKFKANAPQLRKTVQRIVDATDLDDIVDDNGKPMKFTAAAQDQV